MIECAVCDGRFSVDLLVELQLGPSITMVPVPLCAKHYLECEGAIQDLQNIKSPPCVVNITAIGIGSNPARFG